MRASLLAYYGGVLSSLYLPVGVERLPWYHLFWQLYVVLGVGPSLWYHFQVKQPRLCHGLVVGPRPTV